MLKIVDKLLAELRDQLSAKDVAIEASDEAKTWLGRRGYDPKFGARPMARLIEREIKRPLVDQILFGDLAGGGTVTVEPPKDATSESGMELSFKAD